MNRDDNMTLPKGASCKDCFHFKRCNTIFGHVETDTLCDWSLRRFAPSTKYKNKQADLLKEAAELLDLCLDAFNHIVNTDIQDEKGTKTYDIASAISKFFTKTKGG